MRYKPTLSDKIAGEYLPFIIIGFGAVSLKWMVVGDAVKSVL